MVLKHVMPVQEGSALTLDSMSSEESIQLLRNIVGALANKQAGLAEITGDEMVRAQLSEIKFTILPSPCGQYIEEIRIYSLMPDKPPVTGLVKGKF